MDCFGLLLKYRRGHHLIEEWKQCLLVSENPFLYFLRLIDTVNVNGFPELLILVNGQVANLDVKIATDFCLSHPRDVSMISHEWTTRNTHSVWLSMKSILWFNIWSSFVHQGFVREVFRNRWTPATTIKEVPGKRCRVFHCHFFWTLYVSVRRT